MTEADPAAPPVGHDDHVSLQAAFGGKAGLLDAGLPGVLFVLSYTFTGRDLGLSLIIALASAALLSIIRLAQHRSLQYALSGFFGVGIAAFIASRTGRAEDFYLPGLLANVAYASLFLISIAVRWPIIGVMLSLVTQAGAGWRKDPVLVRAYTRASWVWVAMFVIRLAVQIPFWLIGEDALVALGTARAALGVRLYLVVLWVTYRVLKASVPVGTSVMPPRPVEADEADEVQVADQADDADEAGQPADRDTVPGN